LEPWTSCEFDFTRDGKLLNHGHHANLTLQEMAN
ncbi:hypothetical protein SY3_01054, partial [Staphylococcus aureus M0221]